MRSSQTPGMHLLPEENLFRNWGVTLANEIGPAYRDSRGVTHGMAFHGCLPAPQGRAGRGNLMLYPPASVRGMQVVPPKHTHDLRGGNPRIPLLSDDLMNPRAADSAYWKRRGSTPGASAPHKRSSTLTLSISLHVALEIHVHITLSRVPFSSSGSLTQWKTPIAQHTLY